MSVQWGLVFYCLFDCCCYVAYQPIKSLTETTTSKKKKISHPTIHPTLTLQYHTLHKLRCFPYIVQWQYLSHSHSVYSTHTHTPNISVHTTNILTIHLTLPWEACAEGIYIIPVPWWLKYWCIGFTSCTRQTRYGEAEEGWPSLWERERTFLTRSQI